MAAKPSRSVGSTQQATGPCCTVILPGPTGALPTAQTAPEEWYAGLVNDLDFARSQVAFMGYWREGVAMRS